MVFVSPLVDQFSGLFLIFFGRPKKICPVSGNFLLISGNFWSTKFLFGIPTFFLVDQIFQNFPETDQKFPETGQFFWGSTKKIEKKTGQLVDQEPDQNHMDGTHGEELTNLEKKSRLFLN